MVVFGQKWLFLGKVVVFGQNGCIRAKVDVFVQKGCILDVIGCNWTNCCIRANMVVFE